VTLSFGATGLYGEVFGIVVIDARAVEPPDVIVQDGQSESPANSPSGARVLRLRTDGDGVLDIAGFIATARRRGGLGGTALCCNWAATIGLRGGKRCSATSA
jgi:hypothetical protein